jgi:hypothetical protein
MLENNHVYSLEIIKKRKIKTVMIKIIIFKITIWEFFFFIIEMNYLNERFE